MERQNLFFYYGQRRTTTTTTTALTTDNTDVTATANGNGNGKTVPHQLGAGHVKAARAPNYGTAKQIPDGRL
jgi:hypothetical protein